MSVRKSRWPCAIPLPAALGLFGLLVVGIKVFEDVITQDAGPFDTAVLWFRRQNIPPAMTDFFSLVTTTGAGTFLVTTTVLLAAILLLLTHRREALLVAVTMASAGLATFAITALVNRSRPDLLGSRSYSSSSFPSEHTLCTTALATALVLCISRVAPSSRYAALGAAALWVASLPCRAWHWRAHWPTDVLAAAILGVFIPVAISTLLDLHPPRWLTR